MRFLNKLILFLCLFSFPYLLLGQYYPSKNYSTTDGLPNNAVRSLFLDSENILWIGTENGVSRMENGSFSNLDETDGLGHNSCWDINQDTNGNMWFASYGGGISKYDGKKFTVFTIKNGLLADKTRKVFPFKNKMYVGTEQGVSIIDINTNKLVTPKVPPHKEDFISISFFEYNDEVYFATIFDGLFKIDESGIKPIIIPILFHIKIYGLALYGTTLYSSNEGFINKFNLEDVLKEKISTVKIGKSMVWQYAKDKQNTIFAAAWGVYKPDGGLYKVENDKMIDVSEYFGIDSKILLNVVYDKSKDILYVGSNDKGIYEVRLDNLIDYNLFDAKSVIDFENFGEQKFILHNKGLTIKNSDKKIIKTISSLNFKNFELNFLKKGNKFVAKQGVELRDFELDFTIPASSIEFYEIVKNENSFWIGSNIGIFEINSLGNIINYLPKHSLKIGFTYNGKFIETITYAGTRLYENVHSLDNKHFSKFEKNTPQYIVKILTNKDKTYLISVFNGLYVYKNNQFHSYLAEGIWNEKKFKHITVNHKGQLVLAAEFGNVFIVEDSKDFKIIKTISKKEIVGNTILFLESYKDFILIGTEKGINLYKDGVVRLIDKEQGLKDAAVTTSKIFENQLWLGTKKGYFTINLNRLTAPQMTVSELVISTIAINNIPISSTNYKWFRFNSKELICDYNDNSFSIDFIPKGHAIPNKLKFRYRLKNTDRWSPYSEKTNLFLPYLPYGSYDLEVEIFDSNAGKATIFKLLKIHIEPPFWMTWWFIALVVLLVFNVLVYLIFKSKKKSREKAVIQKRIAETKLEALLSQMNPHFTFNAMNAIQDYIISNDIDNSLKYIGEFAKLIRKTLENSSKQTITVEEEIEYLKSYIMIENMRFDNRIETEFKIGGDVDVYHSKIPTMLLQPFVENVFVHAFNASHPAPKLIISFEMVSKNVLECKIIDNGMSLNAAKKTKFHHSKGIQLTKERLSLLQNSNVNPINIQLTENNGTTVTIKLSV
ncbi:sensor histidine kinase [Flavobacterium caseinilyticum]|uniref:Histidine kinase n=1 Tax=Flavobacterium caseinilyticum TaxID=2541732 RepID=A0A4R5ARW9_9FLAO|nr:histidine kinase [Flavobacterium caseinilyticum]TDD75005.1 histidine kinase [Flavobacterium caseinilyticum]